MKYLSIALIIFLVLTGCEKEKSQEEKDDEIINNYLSENNLHAEYLDYGLYYSIMEEGSGGYPEVTNTVVVKYKGYLTDNQVFDETTGEETYEYLLSNLIAGRQLGLPLIQKGGKEVLFIPSALGYGPYNVGSIPANSVLIFEIQLVNFY